MDMFEGGEIALYGLESDFGDKLEFHFILFYFCSNIRDFLSYFEDFCL